MNGVLIFFEKLFIYLKIANGMMFLGSKGILHLDLATRNILLTSPEEIAKISDFGLSKFETELSPDCMEDRGKRHNFACKFSFAVSIFVFLYFLVPFLFCFCFSVFCKSADSELALWSVATLRGVS